MTLPRAFRSLFSSGPGQGRTPGMKSTKEGRRSLLAAGLIGVAAVNTGNNLIYLVLSLLLAFLLLAYILPRLTLMKLRPELRLDGPLYAGEPSAATLTVFNGKRFFPAYSVHITSSMFPGPLFLQQLPGSGAAEKQAKAVFGRRGFYPEISLTLESSFPFIFFYALRRVSVALNVLVYPACYDSDLLSGTPSGLALPGGISPAGGGDEMAYLRRFRDGDDPRQISWKATAKGSGLMVREYALQESRRTTVILVSGYPEAEGDFEKAVSIAAGTARSLIGRGCTLRMLAGGQVVPFGAGEEQLLKILDLLALVREDSQEPEGLLPDEAGECIVVLKSSKLRVPGGLPSGARVIYADSV